VYSLKKGEVGIIFKPVLDEYGEWTGSISTGLAFGGQGDPEAMHASMDMAITLICIPPYMEEYPELEDDLVDYKHDVLSRLFPEAYNSAKDAVDKEREYTKEGNVITLTAWTKTEGSA
jgi:hypothetical protein